MAKRKNRNMAQPENNPVSNERAYQPEDFDRIPPCFIGCGKQATGTIHTAGQTLAVCSPECGATAKDFKAGVSRN